MNTTGIELITAERERQVSHEGYTPEHDDRHDDNSLAESAICYASLIDAEPQMAAAPPMWPWEESAWKPNADRIRNLTKAGALIAAELDRLLRLANPKRSTFERVRDVLVNDIGLDRDKITETANFIEDLGADSLDTIEIIMALEEEFELDTIPDEEAEKIETVGQAVAYLETLKK